MRDLEHTWEAASAPAEREAKAQSALDLATEMSESAGWLAMQSAIRLQIKDTMNDLARSQVDDEQNRGVIRSLTHVLEMPDRLIRAASAELDTHR